MASLWLQVRNGGLFPVDEAGKDFVASVSTPEVKAEVTEATLRSIPEHRLFFKVIASVWEGNDRYKERYTNPEQLRAHLLIKAGHCETDTYEADTEEAAIKLVGVLRSNFERARQKGQYAITRYFQDDDGHFFAVFEIPKSIAIHGPKSIGQYKFNLIVNTVFDIIHGETRISVEDLRRTWDELRSQNKVRKAA